MGKKTLGEETGNSIDTTIHTSTGWDTEGITIEEPDLNEDEREAMMENISKNRGHLFLEVESENGPFDPNNTMVFGKKISRKLFGSFFRAKDPSDLYGRPVTAYYDNSKLVGIDPR